MALNKAIQLGQTGVNANYWKIGEKHEDIRAKTIRVILHGYVSQEASENPEVNPLFAVEHTISGESYKRDMSEKEIYEAISENEDGGFADAVAA